MNMRLTIRKKITIGFFSLFLVLCITILLTLSELSVVKQFSNNLKNYLLPGYEAESQFDFAVMDTAALLKAWILTRNPQYNVEREAEWKRLDDDIATFERSEPNWKNAKVQTKWNEIKPLIMKLKQQESEVEKTIQDNITDPAIIQENEKKAVQQIQVTTIPLHDKLILLIDGNDITHNDLSDLLYSLLAKNSDDLNSGLAVLNIVEWILLTTGIVLAFFIAFLTSRSIVLPIQKAIAIATSIAKGDRDLKIAVRGNDEAADLLKALNTMYNGIVDSESKLKYSESEVQRLLMDLQERIKLYCAHIDSLSKGDLTKTLTLQGEDDLTMLGRYLNVMTRSLSKVAEQIVLAANEMSTGLNQLENATTSQAASASEQAASVAEVSSVVEEIKTTSRQTLDKASNLGVMSEKTHSKGEKGKESISEMVFSMQDLQTKMQLIADTILGLSDKTQEIGDITEAVSDIAKQSRLLALNAAIEAAKAGEAGKGFAVVAAEVKILAEKSQAATDNVRQILQGIRQATERAVMVTEEGTKGVEANLKKVNETGDIINALGDVIQQSSIASQQIAAAVKEESVGIDQMVTSIGEIDKVTLQFSNATEQTRQATLNLAKVADNLKESVSIYKLK